ncbi:hypothetical protein ON010_g15896 [Phytophthora cinnamomi]|nr:hypothetical protein ON010_g15896 [Phytophthora cinnamomi]
MLLSTNRIFGYDAGGAGAGDKDGDMNAHDVERETALADDFEDGETVAYQDTIGSGEGEATSFTEVKWIIKERAEFWNRGYFVIENVFLAIDEVKMILREIKGLHARKWLRELRNPTRRQAVIDADRDFAHPAFHLAYERLVAFVSSVHPAWSLLGRFTVVESLPPSRKGEQLHRDFQSCETAAAMIATEWVQASLLLVLEEDADLILVPGGFAGASPKTSCSNLGALSLVSLVVYRGDLPHADVPYQHGNIRVQAYVNVDGVDHDDRVVEPVVGLSNHVQYCAGNPDKKMIAERRKRNNDKGAYCKHCKRHFGKKNTHHAHDCPGHCRNNDTEGDD